MYKTLLSVPCKLADPVDFKYPLTRYITDELKQDPADFAEGELFIAGVPVLSLSLSPPTPTPPPRPLRRLVLSFSRSLVLTLAAFAEDGCDD
jgi:hypothetical protein